MAEALQPGAAAMALLFVLFTVAHLLVLPPGPRRIMAPLAAGTAVFFTAAALILRRKEIRIDRAHAGGAAMAAAVLLNVLTHMAVVGEWWNTTNLLLVLIGAGCFFLSYRWLAALVAVTWVGWELVAYATQPARPIHVDYFLLGASVLALLVCVVRRRTLLRMEHLRQDAESVRQDLDRKVRERTQELAEANAALRAEEENTRSIVENAVAGFFLISPEGRLLSANAAMAAMFGYASPAEMVEAVTDVGTRLFADPEDTARFESSLDPEGRVSGFEARAYRKDRSILWISASVRAVLDDAGEVVRYEGAVQDVTARRGAEEDLRYVMAHAQCLLWHALVERDENPGAPAPFAWSRHVFDDAAAQRFMPLEVPPGQTYRDAWHYCRPPEDRAQGERTYIEALTSGQTEYAQEFRCIDRDGALHWVHEQVHVDPLPGGQWRLVGVCTDVTERKRLEEVLRLRAEALTEADRRKDEFLAMLAHELRNPLAPIRNAVYLLTERTPEDPALRRAHAVLDRQVRQMARLVDDLLDVSRITRGKIDLRAEPADLRAIVTNAVQTCRPFIDARGHRLEMSLPAAPLLASVDGARMEQVVANLVNNAAKYTPPGGEIRLSLELEAEEGVLRVKDTGVGIAPELLPRVFEPFVQADHSLERTHGGLGLGLTLVHRLVELHGGTVSAHSDGPGAGCEFTVRLPAAAARPAPSAPSGAAGPAAEQRPLRVLVVDDNEDATETLTDLLELWGHGVRTAHDGRAALAAAEEYAPDVVLLDIGLPGMDGYEVAVHLRSRPECAARLVAVTGYGQEEDRRRSREAGFDLHLTKPVDPEELKRVLAAAPAGSTPHR
jgi:PAS domain S-box-containing protein